MEKEAKITVHPSFEIGEISPRLVFNISGTDWNNGKWNDVQPEASDSG